MELIHLNDLNDDVTLILSTNQRPRNWLGQTTDEKWQKINLLAGPALWAGAYKNEDKLTMETTLGLPQKQGQPRPKELTQNGDDLQNEGGLKIQENKLG